MDHKAQQDERIKELIAQDIEPSDDGFYYWFPNKTTGYLSAYVLRTIADILDVKNEAWEKQLTEYFDENPELHPDVYFDENKEPKSEEHGLGYYGEW